MKGTIDMAICNVSIANETLMNFTTSVEIPIGFAINPTPDNPGQEYRSYLTLDKHAVEYTQEEQLFPATVTVPNPDNPGTSVTTECMTRIRILKIAGPLFYNAIITGFIPLEHLNATGEDVALNDPTAFTSSKTLEVNQLIGYSCYECEMPENILDGFDIIIQKANEFVVDENGTITHYNESAPNEYYGVFDGKNMKTVHITFTIILRPKQTQPDAPVTP